MAPKARNRNLSPIEPLDDQVVLIEDAKPDKTEGGILIPPTAKEAGGSMSAGVNWARVIAVGPGVRTPEDPTKRCPIENVQVGDLVIFMPHGTLGVEIDKETYLLVPECNIRGKKVETADERSERLARYERAYAGELPGAGDKPGTGEASSDGAAAAGPEHRAPGERGDPGPAGGADSSADAATGPRFTLVGDDPAAGDSHDDDAAVGPGPGARAGGGSAPEGDVATDPTGDLRVDPPV